MTVPALPFDNPSFLGYLVAFVVATLAPFAGAYRARSIPDPEVRQGLCALLATSSAWAAAHVGMLLTTAPLIKDVLYTTGLIVGFTTVGAWLYFCSAYAGRTLHRDRTVQRLAIAIFAVVAVLKVTNPYHHLYHTLEYIKAPFPHLAIRHHLLYWVIMGLSYALSLVGGFMLLELFTNIRRNTSRVLLLLGLIGLPPILNVIGYATPVLLDVTHEPIGVALFATGVLFAYIGDFQSVRLAGSQEVPTIVLNADGRIRDCNDAATQLFPELAHPEAVGQPLAASVPKVDAARGSGQPLVELHRGGGRRYFHVQENRFEVGGVQLGQLVLLADVTQQRRREEQLRAAKEEAEAASRMKTALLTNMGHELRTPLTSMIGYAEAIRDEGGELTSEFGHAIAQSGQRLVGTLESVLTLSKLEAGAMTLAPEPTCLNELIEGVANAQRDQAEEAGVALHADPSARRIQAWANPMGVQVALRHLVANAIKFTGAGGTVWVRCRAEGDGALVEVEDTGIGMEPEAVPELFAPFRQASEGLRREHEGAGLGLAVVQRIVAQMGGAVEVETERGRGSCFTVRVTRTRKTPTARAEAPEATVPEVNTYKGNRSHAP